MLKVKLSNRHIGKKCPCFIAVDIGSNHNKDLKIAKRLIDSAAYSEVDAVKLQIYSAETLYSKKVPRHSQHKKNLWQSIKDIETPRHWIPILKNYCDSKKIAFFATPFDFEAVDQLNPYVDFYKIASFELVDLPLIEYVAKKKKPVIISTGLATINEIKDAYNTCLATGNKKIVFLHCASSYPAPAEIMNLNAMDLIRKRFHTPVGLSDHTLGIHISVAAVAMGANFIEKHLTLNRKMNGPDHPFAIEPEELTLMVKCIRETESALGDGKKKGPSDSEIENYKIGRRSIHSKVPIKKGVTITREMLIIKRPGFGIMPKLISKIIGKKSKIDIEQDIWLTRDMI